FALRLKKHRLRREIIATAITNSLINRMGPVFPVRAQDDTGADPAAIARAYSIARVLRHMTYWLLENRRGDLDIERGVLRYAAKVGELFHELDEVLGVTEHAR